MNQGRGWKRALDLASRNSQQSRPCQPSAITVSLPRGVATEGQSYFHASGRRLHDTIFAQHKNAQSHWLITELGLTWLNRTLGLFKELSCVHPLFYIRSWASGFSLCPVFPVCPSSARTARQANQAVTHLLSSQTFPCGAGLLLFLLRSALTYHSWNPNTNTLSSVCLHHTFFYFHKLIMVWGVWGFFVFFSSLQNVVPSLCLPWIPVQVSDHFSSRSRSGKWMMFPYSPDLVIPQGCHFHNQIPFTLPSLALAFALKATVPVFPSLSAVSSLSHPLWYNTLPLKVLFQECPVVIKHQFCAKCLI